MKISKTLHLSIPLVDESDETKVIGYVHSSPLSSEVWNIYWDPIMLAFTRVMSGGYGTIGGPRAAHRVLEKISRERDIWDGPTGVKAGLINEIYRNSMLMHVGANGWESIPFEQAKKLALISPEDAEEVEGGLVFFMLGWFGHRRTLRQRMLEAAMGLWDAQIIWLNSTDYLNSLTISTADASSGESRAAAG